jgi:hypothetical protein
MTTPKVESLRALIAAEIAVNPFEHEGFQWAARPQEWWTEQLGFSVSTLNRLIRKPPFVRQTKQIDKKNTTLLREGKPGQKTPRHVANIMSRIWRKRYDRPVTRAEYGCMIGLAQEWPEGYQVEIFKRVISNEGWPEFMAGAWIEITKLDGVKRFYKFPTLTVMRRFHTVAVELYQMHAQQKAGKASADISNPKSLNLKPGGSFPALQALKGKKVGA